MSSRPHFTRRQMLRASGAAIVSAAASKLLKADMPASAPSTAVASINRQAVVRRHNPVVRKIDPFSALSIGNGQFAFTADVTGLQTFPDAYQKQFPLCTASHWGWHSTPLPAGLDPKQFRYEMYDTFGRPVGYATDKRAQGPLFNWMRENPHRLHLGRIGLDIAKPESIGNAQQTLDLWTGQLESKFEIDGVAVRVRSCCHPTLDMLAVRIESSLIGQGKLNVRLVFPYGSSRPDMADWDSPLKHQTQASRGKWRADFTRTLDAEKYSVAMAWKDTAELSQRGAHEYLLSGSGDSLEFVCCFSSDAIPIELPSAEQTFDAATKHWQQFWSEGGAIDLGNCTAASAPELERRIVLSQYNTAIHCAGSLPSAETGLLFNSWYGKCHLEMHWWHSVHFAAWNRFSLFERSLPIYQRLLPLAQETAKRQGYRGARWPKMIGPDGRDSPSPVGPLLIWQQPHPIYYAELCYRHDPSPATIDKWRDIVFQSADFMASFAHWLPERGQFVLGPPMKTVSENQDARKIFNPTFELTYWRTGLRIAQQWRERAKLPRDAQWDEVLKQLSRAPTQDAMYLFQEGCGDTYANWNWEHPAILGACGMLSGDGIDRETMRRSIRKVMEVWQWDRAWGWDFPLAAMAAARCGEPELAIEALMIDSPKNRWHPNGHVYQREDLTAYLPANGGLLAAIAMMAGGWTDGPTTAAPGFPRNGKWAVRSEGMGRWM